MLSQLFDDKDHTDWHRGIREYGFWCLQVKDPNWLERITFLQAQLADILLENYARFSHITVSAVGLMTDENQAIVERQFKLLKELQFKSFSVFYQTLSSYLHVPIVRVKIYDRSLFELRKTMHSISSGEDALEYDPHITLGYYNKVLDIDSVFPEKMAALGPFQANELLFCTYQTSSIKGPIEIKHRIQLT